MGSRSLLLVALWHDSSSTRNCILATTSSSDRIRILSRVLLQLNLLLLSLLWIGRQNVLCGLLWVTRSTGAIRNHKLIRIGRSTHHRRIHIYNIAGRLVARRKGHEATLRHFLLCTRICTL